MQTYLYKKQQNDAEPSGSRSTMPLGDRLDANPRVEALGQLKAALNARPGDRPMPIQRKSSGNGLPEGLKSGVESLSGLPMDDVSVHYDSPQPARLGALAYAQGTDIHLAPGQERHLPHEAWHVAQQKRGQVRPTTQAKGVPVNDEPALEAEADRMGEQAKAGLYMAKGTKDGVAISTNVLQGVWNKQEDGRLAWSEPLDGRQWYREEGLYWFSTAGSASSASAQGAEIASERKTRGEWEKAGLLLPIGEEPVDPIEKIRHQNFESIQSKPIGGSRGKHVYLFDPNGDPTSNKDDARFMVQTKNNNAEYEAFDFLRGKGIRTPKLYGKTKGGCYIVEWIPKAVTVGGGGIPLEANVKTAMTIKSINAKKTGEETVFDVAKWETTLADVEAFIEKGFTSKDLQAMVAEDGHLVIMDIEPNNLPEFSDTPDPRFVALKEFLEKSIEMKRPADLAPASSTPKTSLFTSPSSSIDKATGRGGSTQSGSASGSKNPLDRIRKGF